MRFWQEILETSYGENLNPLSQLVLDRYRVATNRQTNRWMDRITVANTHYSYASFRV